MDELIIEAVRLDRSLTYLIGHAITIALPTIRSLKSPE